MRQPTQLLRRVDNQFVEAILLTAEDKHLEDFEQLWKPQLRFTMEEDRYWNWVFKTRIYRSDNFETYAIECDGETQGLMMIDVQRHRSQVDSRRRVVYVRSLATAPWNRVSLQETPRYRAVGGTLLRFARHRSFELGYGGLVGLHALPGAEAFYEKMNMLNGGADPESEDLTYFEWYRPQEATDDGFPTE